MMDMNSVIGQLTSLKGERQVHISTFRISSRQEIYISHISTSYKDLDISSIESYDFFNISFAHIIIIFNSVTIEYIDVQKYIRFSFEIIDPKSQSEAFLKILVSQSVIYETVHLQLIPWSGEFRYFIQSVLIMIRVCYIE